MYTVLVLPKGKVGFSAINITARPLQFSSSKFKVLLEKAFCLRGKRGVRHPILNFAVTLSKHSKLNLGFNSEPSLNWHILTHLATKELPPD